MSWRPRSNSLGGIKLLIGWLVFAACIVMLGAGVRIIYAGLGVA